jgi:hypothetical protein
MAGGVGRGGGAGVGGVVDGAADEGAGAEEAAGVGPGGVLRAEVDAVGSGIAGDSRVVVDDAECAVRVADGDDFTGKREPAVGRGVFCPELDVSGADGTEGAGLGGVVAERMVVVGDGDEKRGGTGQGWRDGRRNNPGLQI